MLRCTKRVRCSPGVPLAPPRCRLSLFVSLVPDVAHALHRACAVRARPFSHCTAARSAGGAPPQPDPSPAQVRTARSAESRGCARPCNSLTSPRHPTQDRYLTVPNAMTMVRMVLGPYVAYALLHGEAHAAFVAFAVAGCLDGLDGWVARRFNQASIIGSYLDPLADKVLIASASVALVWTGGLPWWAVFVMVGRDAGLVVGGLLHRARTKPQGVGFFSTDHDSTLRVEPSGLSKTNTALQFLLLTCGLTTAAWGSPGVEAVTALSVLATGTTLASGYGYWHKLPFAATAKARKG